LKEKGLLLRPLDVGAILLEGRGESVSPRRRKEGLSTTTRADEEHHLLRGEEKKGFRRPRGEKGHFHFNGRKEHSTKESLTVESFFEDRLSEKGKEKEIAPSSEENLCVFERTPQPEEVGKRGTLKSLQKGLTFLKETKGRGLFRRELFSTLSQWRGGNEAVKGVEETRRGTRLDAGDAGGGGGGLARKRDVSGKKH